MGDLSTGPQV